MRVRGNHCATPAKRTRTAPEKGYRDGGCFVLSERITCFRVSFKFTASPRESSDSQVSDSQVSTGKGRWARATNDEGGGERVSPFAHRHCHHQDTSIPLAHAFISHNERHTCPTVAIQLTRPAILRALDSLADHAPFPSRFRSRSYVLLLRAPLRLGGSGWRFSNSSRSRRFGAFSVLRIAGTARANATISIICVNRSSTADQLNRQERK